MANKTSLGRYRNAELISEYWSENGQRCEVWPLLPERDRVDVERLRKTNTKRSLELHHILGDQHYKVDNWSNVIIICPVIHRAWGHSKNPVELRVVCLYAKFRKAEFDVQELNVAGQKPTIYNELQRLKWKLSHRPEYVEMCNEMLATLPAPV